MLSLLAQTFQHKLKLSPMPLAHGSKLNQQTVTIKLVEYPTENIKSTTHLIGCTMFPSRVEE